MDDGHFGHFETNTLPRNDLQARPTVHTVDTLDTLGKRPRRAPVRERHGLSYLAVLGRVAVTRPPMKSGGRISDLTDPEAAMMMNCTDEEITLWREALNEAEYPDKPIVRTQARTCHVTDDRWAAYAPAPGLFGLTA